MWRKRHSPTWYFIAATHAWCILREDGKLHTVFHSRLVHSWSKIKNGVRSLACHKYSCTFRKKTKNTRNMFRVYKFIFLCRYDEKTAELKFLLFSLAPVSLPIGIINQEKQSTECRCKVCPNKEISTSEIVGWDIQVEIVSDFCSEPSHRNLKRRTQNSAQWLTWQLNQVLH